MTTYNTQNLVSITTRPESEQRAIRAKGGAAGKGKIRYDQRACSKCNLPCPLKDEGTKEHWKCRVPDMKRLVLEAATDISKLDMAMIRDAWEIETVAKNARDKKLAFDAKRELRQILAPEPQRIQIEMHSMNLVKTLIEEIRNDKREGMEPTQGK